MLENFFFEAGKSPASVRRAYGHLGRDLLLCYCYNKGSNHFHLVVSVKTFTDYNRCQNVNM